MRLFTQPIVHGPRRDPIQDLTTDGQCYRLHERLREGLGIQRGLQHEISLTAWRQDLEDIVVDIAMALGIGVQIIPLDTYADKRNPLYKD